MVYEDEWLRIPTSSVIHEITISLVVPYVNAHSLKKDGLR